MFVIFSGVSGVGKNTIINELLKDGDNRFLIKSATTRERRGEGMDNNYEIITDEEFDRREKNGEFFETITAHQYRYATQIKDIEVIGTEKLVEYLRGKAKVLTIFLDAPDDILYDRLLNRGESEERAKLRLSRAKMERGYKPKYDIKIENLDLEETLKTIRNRLKKEGY